MNAHSGTCRSTVRLRLARPCDREGGRERISTVCRPYMESSPQIDPQRPLWYLCPICQIHCTSLIRMYVGESDNTWASQKQTEQLIHAWRPIQQNCLRQWTIVSSKWSQYYYYYFTTMVHACMIHISYKVVDFISVWCTPVRYMWKQLNDNY